MLDHERVEDCPLIMVDGDIEKLLIEGAESTLTVTLSEVEPPGPEQEMPNVVLVVKLPELCEPEVPLEPLQFELAGDAEAVHDEAFVDDQVKVAEVLYGMEKGPLMSAVGNKITGGEDTFTVTLSAIVPFTPVQEMVNLVLTIKFPVL